MEKTILICEDEKDLNQDLKDVLELSFENIKVHSVYDRDSAIDAIKKQSFTVAIIDLNLEGGTNPIDWSKTGGVQVIKVIIDQNFGTEILVLSGNPETELSFSLSKEYGISEYIKKGDRTSTDRIVKSVGNLLNKNNDFIDKLSNKKALFSGVKGVDKSIWESNAVSILDLNGGMKELDVIAFNILEMFYPYIHSNKNGLYLDKQNRCITGEIWSFKRGKSYKISIENIKINSSSSSQNEEDTNISKIHNDIYVYSRQTNSSIDDFHSDG